MMVKAMRADTSLCVSTCACAEPVTTTAEISPATAPDRNPMTSLPFDVDATRIAAGAASMIAFAQQKSSAWRMSRRKPGLDLIRAGYRFAEKDLRHSMTSSAADLKFFGSGALEPVPIPTERDSPMARGRRDMRQPLIAWRDCVIRAAA